MIFFCRREMDMVAEALLQYETLDAEDVKAIIEGNPRHVQTKMAASAIPTPENNKIAVDGGGPSTVNPHPIPAAKRPEEILNVS